MRRSRRLRDGLELRATWVAGRSGNALSFDGSNDHAELGKVLDLYNTIAIAAWIKPSGLVGHQDIVCKNWQTSYRGYEFGLVGTELKFRINPSSTSWEYRYSSGAALTKNVWQHVAAVYDGTTVAFYKDGVLISTVAAGGKLYSSSAVALYLGVHFSLGDAFFGGAMDELRIYDRALSAAEVSRLHSMP